MFDKKRFKAQMILAGVTMKDLAEELGVDESTMYRKINLDGNFTREQINKLVQVLKIDTPMDIFFCPRTCGNAREMR